ncbi:MAG TPA: sterol desaturase family protein [Hanamia sp.]|nr:sterol desaturase family protein [Hanamia sp.]
MYLFIGFISRNPDEIQLALFVSTLFLCWNIENIAALTLNYKKWQHAFLNVRFILTNSPIQLVMGIAFAGVIKWTAVHDFGLLYYIPTFHNPLILFLITFLLLDLGEYVYHIIMHKIKMLWMFHLVHHSDNVVDVSTTLREHPGENIIRLSFTLLWVFISGAVFWVLILRQIIQVFTTLFAHMNYRLPDKFDSVLGLILITPNLHHVHHHFQEPYTNSNYGDVLSIWDRLFGTFKKLDSKNLVFGVDSHMKNEDQSNFKSLFKIPFKNPGKKKVANR